MKNLTFEETSLIAIYNDSSREGTITNLREMQGHLAEDEQELKELTDSAVAKLAAMTDEVFSELDLGLEF